MGVKHLIRDPQHVNKDRSWWFYEWPSGISVVVEFNDGTRIVNIPWARIRAALKRKDKKP